MTLNLPADTPTASRQNRDINIPNQMRGRRREARLGNIPLTANGGAGSIGRPRCRISLDNSAFFLSGVLASRTITDIVDTRNPTPLDPWAHLFNERSNT